MAVPQANPIVPDPTILRLPTYLEYLLSCRDAGQESLPSSQIAEALGLTGIQVRKDLAWISDSGKPRRGYPIDPLIQDIRTFLGYHREKIAFLAGAGHLGTALLYYQGFAEYGIKIVAAFDSSQTLQGNTIGKTPVYAVDEMARLAAEHDPQMLIICVPGDEAQSVADRCVEAGIKVIWNFAPVTLRVDDDVVVENMNMAQSLALLSNRAMMHQQRQLRNAEEGNE